MKIGFRIIPRGRNPSQICFWVHSFLWNARKNAACQHESDKMKNLPWYFEKNRVLKELPSMVWPWWGQEKRVPNIYPIPHWLCYYPCFFFNFLIPARYYLLCTRSLLRWSYEYFFPDLKERGIRYRAGKNRAVPCIIHHSTRRCMQEHNEMPSRYGVSDQERAHKLGYANESWHWACWCTFQYQLGHVFPTPQVYLGLVMRVTTVHCTV